jgi:hypothetical protein
MFKQKDMGFAVMFSVNKATTGFFVLHFHILLFWQNFH